MERGQEEDDSALSGHSDQPYSPSDSAVIDMPEDMDWQSNLEGVPALLGEHSEQLTGTERNSADQQALETEQEQANTTGPTATPPDATGAEPAAADGSTQQPSDDSGATRRAAPEHEQPDIVARAKAFLHANVTRRCNAIIDSFGEDALAYDTIRSHNKTKFKHTDLVSGEVKTTSSAGAMVDRLDGRVRLAQLDVNLGQKQAWTYSLDVKIMEFIGCKSHFNQQPFPRRGSSIRGCRQAIWVTDHSMPPILPTKMTQQCIKIIRLDCGTLQELTEGLGTMWSTALCPTCYWMAVMTSLPSGQFLRLANGPDWPSGTRQCTYTTALEWWRCNCEPEGWTVCNPFNGAHCAFLWLNLARTVRKQ
jgi:hypothetical protein